MTATPRRRRRTWTSPRFSAPHIHEEPVRPMPVTIEPLPEPRPKAQPVRSPHPFSIPEDLVRPARAIALIASYTGCLEEAVDLPRSGPLAGRLSRAVTRAARLAAVEARLLGSDESEVQRFTEILCSIADELDQIEETGRASLAADDQLNAPPPDRFRPDDVWRSPRGQIVQVLDAWKWRGSSLREIGLRVKDNGAVRWRLATNVGSGGHAWTRISWGGRG